MTVVSFQFPERVKLSKCDLAHSKIVYVVSSNAVNHGLTDLKSRSTSLTFAVSGAKGDVAV